MAFPAENQKFAVHFNVLAITPSLHRHLDRASRPMPAFGAATALDPQPATPPGFNNCSVHTHPTPHRTRLNHHKPHSSGSLQIPLVRLAPTVICICVGCLEVSRAPAPTVIRICVGCPGVCPRSANDRRRHVTPEPQLLRQSTISIACSRPS